MTLGLTGACCAGKNEAARILSGRGWQIIDVDNVGHRVLDEMKGRVADRFGSEILRPEGGVDRRRLGALVFEDPAELTALEAIVHPEMRRRVVDTLRDSGEENVCINAALLFPMGLHRHCDAVIRIAAPLPLRFFRAWKRDRLPPRQLLRRFTGRRALFPKFSADMVDMYTIRNLGSRERLEKKLVRTLSRIIGNFERTVG
jgi:dephospho-CoA kinase